MRSSYGAILLSHYSLCICLHTVLTDSVWLSPALTFSVTWGRVALLFFTLETTISNPIYSCLYHRSKGKCHFSNCSNWDSCQFLGLKLLPSMTQQWPFFQNHLYLFLLPSWYKAKITWACSAFYSLIVPPCSNAAVCKNPHLMLFSIHLTRFSFNLSPMHRSVCTVLTSELLWEMTARLWLLSCVCIRFVWWTNVWHGVFPHREVFITTHLREHV